MLRAIISHTVQPRLELAAASAAARRLGLRAFRVRGSNMAPTLQLGDIAWFLRLSGADDLKRGQVVVVESDVFEGVKVPQRVIALPGEQPEIVNGCLIVNGSPVAEPYLQPGRSEQPYSQSVPGVIVPDGHVWLLGDFRDMSNDSRSTGPLPFRTIIGRVTHSHRPGDHANPKIVR